MKNYQSMGPARILSALPVIGHPRDSKRISMLQEAGFIVEAVAFERSYHNGRLPSCDVMSLGVISHGKYLRRILTMIGSLAKIRKTIRRSNVVYASGLDMALMALIAGVGLGRPVIVEIGDIREIQVAVGTRGLMVRAIDRCVVQRCGLLVVTAADFATEYYKKRLCVSTPILVIENKLESESVPRKASSEINKTGLRPLKDRPIRIGYFGLLRCEWSFQVLYKLAEEYKESVFILLAGMGLVPDALNNIIVLPNVLYRGQYKSPEDLHKLYEAVDMVWGCYPPITEADWNLRWARPNRFYEACYFGRPLISRKGSNDGKFVNSRRIGLVSNARTPTEFLEEFKMVDHFRIAEWTNNIRRLPQDIYIYSSESAELKEKINGLIETEEATAKSKLL